MMYNSSNIRSVVPYLSAAVAAWYFYKHFVKPFLSPLRKIPGCPYRPVVGNLIETLREGANNNGLRWMQRYQSRIIRFYFVGGEGAVLVGDPALAKQVLVTNSKNYFRTSNSRLLNDLTPGFLALLNGEDHHALRRLINPVFNAHAIEGFIPVFEKTARKVVHVWQKLVGDKKEETIPAQEYMSRLTMDAICQCGFDYNMGAVEDNCRDVVQAFYSILGGLELSFLQLLGLGWLPTKKNRKIKADVNLYKSTIRDVISSKQDKMETGTNSKDILSLLLQATDENGRHLTQENLYAQVGGFLVAGFETTSVTLTWTLLCLAEHQDVQDKAREEVMSLLSDKNHPVTSELVESMSYLNCVIKESLRLHTPLSTIFRRAQSDDHLGGYFIPARTLVGINLGALHRLPEIWPDPLTFKPERFQEAYDKFSFLPFIAGPYMCVGHLFSMTETKVTLALLLRHFKFALPEGYSYRVVRKLAIQPRPALKLLVSPL